jgi:dipeptidyl aminopeptidase/acylaminoacyl peptidase
MDLDVIAPPCSGARSIRSTTAVALAGLWMLLVSTQALPQQSTEAQAKVPVADFFRTPRLDKPKLSASGRYLAGAVAGNSGRVNLAVFDLENLGESKAVAGFSDADINTFEWVNDQRIVFSVIDLQSGSNNINPLAPGLWAVNRDGSDYRQLINASKNFAFVGTARATIISDRKLPWEWRLHSVLADGSNDVLVQGLTLNSVRDVIDTKLARLDTTTGVTKNLSAGAPDHATSWVVDREGRPAAVTTLHEGRFRAYLKSTPDADWDKWQDAEALTGKYAVPYWVGFDGQLLALARAADDTEVYAVDAKTRKLGAEPMVSLKGYDFGGRIVFDAQARRLLGVHFETDARSTAWIDPVMQATQAAVDTRLPATNNRIDCQRCMSVPTVLVTAASDRQPPLYYLYNRDTKALTLIAASRPWIKAQAMSVRDVYSFAARDGLSIPALVTKPPGNPTSARPAVVLVHGGPWVRGTHWEWEPTAQFLASRGYVVIEPEFRGSTGYGYKLFHAGWKQWGLAMQDDIADATRWAVQQGWVDPKRVCIAGASYGGYATLMGLVRNHELYRCGIEWVGVTDITLMYTITWSDISEEAKGYSMPLLIGDQVADARQLKDTSPLEQAAQVRRPLLMAYGAADRRVPIEHGKEFRDAVSRTNKDVEWIVYRDEGHGWRTLETQVDFWTRVEKFLDDHLRVDAK